MEHSEPRPGIPWKTAFWRAVRMAAAIAFLSWFYGWASPWAYPDAEVGMAHGALHGALMPMALPALVTGQDVPIYAALNNGRPYKIGYIAGINVCGLLVFGSAFLGRRSSIPGGQPAARAGVTSRDSEKG